MKEKLKNIFKNKERTIAFIVSILCASSLLLNCYLEYDRTGQVDTNKISEAISTVVDEINKSSTEIPNLTETDEQSLEVQETEAEGLYFLHVSAASYAYVETCAPMDAPAAVVFFWSSAPAVPFCVAVPLPLHFFFAVFLS